MLLRDDGAGDETGAIALSGRVLLADGSPASGAIVERQAVNQHRSFATHADAEGHFQIASRFEYGISSACAHCGWRRTGGLFGWRRRTCGAAVRRPLAIVLRPSTTQKVSVTAAGKAVAGAEVVVTGDGFNALAVTDAVGQAEVRIPADSKLRSVAALEPSLGSGGQYFRDHPPRQENYAIELEPPAPHEFA